MSVTTSPQRARLEFIDNLRWVMIMLVVSMHAAVTYSHVGSWYFMEDPKPDGFTTALFATYQIFLQAFFMGLLFLIAGYFVPGPFDRKAFAKFLRDRFLRLGIPSLLYMLILQPVIVYWLLRDFANLSRPPLFRAYVPYLTSKRVLSGSGPMWFALALLLFSVVYGIVRRMRLGSAPTKVPPAQVDSPVPGHRHIMGLALLMSLCTFLVRVVQPIGTNIFNMQLCFFSQYVILFVAGILAWRRNWLLRLPYEFGMRWFKLALIAGSLVWVGFLFAILKTHTETMILGGFTWQSAVLSFWESFFCVGICAGLIVLFREKFNQQGSIARWLSDNSFAVYLFHPFFLIAVTLMLRGVEAPKPVKFLCATFLGIIVTYLASSLVFRRIPLLKRIL